MALEMARAGNVLTLWRLDRLGRSLHDLILLGRRLDEMGVGLMSVQEKIDTCSSGGRLVFHMFGALQIEQHLTLALETGCQASEKPVGEGIVDSVLSKQIDDLKPTLTRHGYTAKVLAELLDTKPGEVRAMFRQPLGGERL